MTFISYPNCSCCPGGCCISTCPKCPCAPYEWRLEGTGFSGVYSGLNDTYLLDYLGEASCEWEGTNDSLWLWVLHVDSLGKWHLFAFNEDVPTPSPQYCAIDVLGRKVPFNCNAANTMCLCSYKPPTPPDKPTPPCNNCTGTTPTSYSLVMTGWPKTCSYLKGLNATFQLVQSSDPCVYSFTNPAVPLIITLTISANAFSLEVAETVTTPAPGPSGPFSANGSAFNNGNCCQSITIPFSNITSGFVVLPECDIDAFFPPVAILTADCGDGPPPDGLAPCVTIVPTKKCPCSVCCPTCVNAEVGEGGKGACAFDLIVPPVGDPCADASAGTFHLTYQGGCQWCDFDKSLGLNGECKTWVLVPDVPNCNGWKLASQDGNLLYCADVSAFDCLRGGDFEYNTPPVSLCDVANPTLTLTTIDQPDENLICNVDAGSCCSGPIPAKLHLTVTNINGCGCAEGTYILKFNGNPLNPAWISDVVTICGITGVWNVNCASCAGIGCGATNPPTGTAWLVGFSGNNSMGQNVQLFQDTCADTGCTCPILEAGWDVVNSGNLSGTDPCSLPNGGQVTISFTV